MSLSIKARKERIKRSKNKVKHQTVKNNISFYGNKAWIFYKSKAIYLNKLASVLFYGENTPIYYEESVINLMLAAETNGYRKLGKRH